ncbi:MAG: Fic family protein [Nitrososphaerota archaeon]
MVSIVKRKKGNSVFFYLKHGTGKRSKEVYLGKTIPNDINERKKRFLLEFYREEWLARLKSIHKNYQEELKRTPKDAILKNSESFAISFTYNTQRIEGSTLTFRETADLLVFNITPKRKAIQDMIETKMHKEVFDEMLKRKKKLSLRTILYWHFKMFEQTKPQFAGKIRTYPVGVMGSKAEFPSWRVVPRLLKECFARYNRQRQEINPVELAARAHLEFTTIHPFGDGNGRIARLIMNYILGEFGYPLLDIKFTDRLPYFRSQEKSQIQDNEIYFLKWFMKYYFKTWSTYDNI